MNILITGIHGFVGTNLVEALKADHTIYGLDIVAPEKSGVMRTYAWSEMGEIPAVDVVIHLAGLAHDTKNRTEAQRYYDINTGLTQKIFDWFQASEAKKFIFFSSVKAAADQLNGKVLTEVVIPTPIGPYGESKIAAENYILSNFILQNSNYKLVYILRPCMIHGPGNKGNLNLLYNFVRKGIPYPLGAFKNHRSFMSIDNMSFIINQLIEKNIDSGIYNVGDDETLSTNELITLIANTINKPNRIWSWNPELIRIIARIGTKLHLPLTKDKLQKLTEDYVVSNEKIKKALGIQNMPVKAKDGFVNTIKSFE